MSGGEVLVVGASDERVKAIIAQVPACGDELPSHPPDGESFEAIRDTIRNPDLGAVARQVGEPMPVVSADQIGTPSLLTPITAYRWFIEYGGRYGTGWVNHAHDTVIETTAPYDRYLCASQLSVPTLMMVAREDEMPGANSVVARQVYDSIPAPKELIPLEGGHFGLLYHPGVLFDEASRSQRDFLKEYL